MSYPTTKKPITVAALRHGGTHLITPVIRHMTGKTVYSPKGEGALQCIPSPIVVVFLRDPRNRSVSNVRFKLGAAAVAELTADQRDAALAQYLGSRKTPSSLRPIEYMRAWYQKWKTERGGRATIYSRFEHLANAEQSLGEIKRIAALICEAGLDLRATPEQAHAYAFGTSGTFTGRHSNYLEWFGPQSCRLWRSEFGGALVEAMGYQRDKELQI